MSESQVNREEKSLIQSRWCVIRFRNLNRTSIRSVALTHSTKLFKRNRKGNFEPVDALDAKQKVWSVIFVTDE